MIRPVITAVPVPVVGQGKATTPAANAVIADTGALVAGDYLVEITMGFADTVLAGKGLACEHRNAANAATVAELGVCPAGTAAPIVYKRVSVAANERIRVVNLAVVGAAGSVAQATIRAHLLDPKAQQ